MMGVSAAREQVLALVSGLPSSKRYVRRLLMLQAYFDGSTEQDAALIFAGYLGSVDTWLRFSDEWHELLTLRPRIGSFKMSQMATPAMAERVMFHYRAIDRLPLFGLVCAVPIGDLNKVVKELDLNSDWANPYYLAWRGVITQSIMAADALGFSDPIEFIFDEQSDKIQVIKAWDYLYENAPAWYRRRIKGSPSFKDDTEVLPLQAADLIAWWARRQYISDKTRMKDLFPIEWTNGKDPDLLATELPEERIRVQFLRDIAMAKEHLAPPRLSSHAALLRGEPWQ
jgi:hypothetical protein